MKKKLLLSAFSLGFALFVNAQTTYTYDFGSGTGEYTYTGTPVVAAGASNTAVTPTLEGASAGGGTIRLKKSTNGTPGSMALVSSSSTSFGSGSNFRMVLPNGTSGQKFSVVGWDDASKYSVASFKVKFEAGEKGSFIFAIGNEAASNIFSGGNNPIAGAVAGLRWNYGASSVTLQQLSASTYTNISTANTQTFEAGSDYAVAIYSNNNSTNDVTYKIGTTIYTMAGSSYQVFINGARLLYAAGDFDFPKGSIAADASADALAFFGINNNSNPATEASVLADDVVYGSYVPESVTPLPISLTSFTAKALSNSVQINWSTASESANSHFDVEKSTDGTTFTKFATKAGAGNSTQQLNYTTTDNNPTNGTSYYRLVQYDFDGKQTPYEPQAVKFGLGNDASTLTVYTNNTSSALSIGINSQKPANGNLEIFTIGGQKVYSKSLSLNAGLNNVSVDANLTNGTFIAVFKADGVLLKQKFVR